MESNKINDNMFEILISDHIPGHCVYIGAKYKIIKFLGNR